MGHGPGRMQRRVLEAVARDGEVWLVDLLEDGEPVGGSVYKSLWRAALALPPPTIRSGECQRVGVVTGTGGA